MARRRKNIEEQTAVEPVVAPEPEVASAVATSADTGDTSRPQDKDQAEQMTRAETIAAIVTNVMNASDEENNKVLATQAEVKPEASEGKPEEKNADIDDAAAEVNQASIAMKEAVEVLFAGEELSESFMNKTAALFEAIVNERVEKIEADLTQELCEDFEVQLANEKIFMEEALDSYLTQAASNFMIENAVALESGIKSDLYESMITDISNVVKSYNIAIDDSQVELVSEAYAEVDQLNSNVDQLSEAVAQQREYIAGLEKQLVFEAVASDLTALQRGSLATLAESVEGDSIDVLTDKFVALKEHLLSKGTTISESTESFEVSEEILTEETETPKYTHENMSAYVNAVSSQVRKL